TWLSVDENGGLDAEELRSALTDDTALVSVMWANNETGVIFPVKQIGTIVKAKGIPLHVDAVQAAGKIDLKVKDLPVDLMTISGHKFHAPKGIGALYVKRGLTFPPFMIGGHQERNRRGGTENVPGIIGMGKAAEMALESLPQMGRVAELRDQLERRILESIDDTAINGR